MHPTAESPSFVKKIHEKPALGKEMEPKVESLFSRLGTAIGETVADIQSANKMAKRKFDGDSALMHAARGALTGAVGAGLEKATDMMFDKAWRGEGPIWERFVMGENAGQKLAQLAQDHPRLSHFIKEGTQDISLAALYNFLAYRSQPIFESVEAKHVLASVGLNALEAGFLKSIPAEMQQTAKNIKRAATKSVQSSYAATRFQGEKKGAFQHTFHLNPQDSTTFDDFLKWNKKGTKPEPSRFTKTRQYNVRTSPTALPERVSLVGNMLSISNPVTLMGLEMVWDGVSTFAKNYKTVSEARKVEKWSGGKAVTPGKGDKVYYGASTQGHNQYRRRSYDDRRDDT